MASTPGCQMGLPLMPRPRTVVKVRKVSAVDQVVGYFSAVRGPIPGSGWGKLREQASEILEAGYTVAQVRQCIDWLDDEYGDLNEWGLAFVARKMPDSIRHEEELEEEFFDPGEVIVPAGWVPGRR